MRPFKCGRKGFGATQVRLDDFVGEFAMLGRIASQSAYLELIAGLEGAYYGAPCCPVAPTTAMSFLFVRSICSVPLFHYLLMASLSI